MKNNQKTKLGYDISLGQFFSPQELVNFCVSLIKNKNGRLLEPSCGDLAFKQCLNENAIFIEIDKNLIEEISKENESVLNIDFLTYPLSEKFDTIIGNPPYVKANYFPIENIKYNSIINTKANLYLYFIEKCFYHLKEKGEIIFIVPRDFIKLTSARKINELLYQNGTITDFYDFGDENFFKEANVNVCVFRYEKGNFNYKTNTFLGERSLKINNGIISFEILNNFENEKQLKSLNEFFDIKVGATSGKDELFLSENGEDFVFSKTKATNELKKMIYQTYHIDLEKNKEELYKRKIKKINEKNWWTWGRPVNFQENKRRIYVNCKTRKENPFFINSCTKWDGSILALFPKENLSHLTLEEIVNRLNKINWKEKGFVVGNRFIFGQKSLSQSLIEEDYFKNI